MATAINRAGGPEDYFCMTAVPTRPSAANSIPRARAVAPLGSPEIGSTRR